MPLIPVKVRKDCECWILDNFKVFEGMWAEVALSESTVSTVEVYCDGAVWGCLEDTTYFLYKYVVKSEEIREIFSTVFDYKALLGEDGTRKLLRRLEGELAKFNLKFIWRENVDRVYLYRLPLSIEETDDAYILHYCSTSVGVAEELTRAIELFPADVRKKLTSFVNRHRRRVLIELHVLKDRELPYVVDEGYRETWAETSKASVWTSIFTYNVKLVPKSTETGVYYSSTGYMLHVERLPALMLYLMYGFTGDVNHYVPRVLIFV